MSTAPAQPGILASPPAHGLSMTFRLGLEVDPRAALLRVADFDTAWGVVGLGEPFVKALGVNVPGLRPFPQYPGAARAIPSTQGALWVLVRGDDRTAVHDRSRAVQALLAGPFVLDDAQDVFTYAGGRDLTGYEDGTANPSAEDSPGVALDETGASFVAVQRWVHDLRQFRTHAQPERDAMMGRRLADNVELTDAPPSAHVQRTAQETFAPPAFVVRRSMPWATPTEEGLEFIAYGHTPDAYERLLRHMVGLDDGVEDALFRFSRPVTGGAYWCPPVRVGGRLDLSAFTP